MNCRPAAAAPESEARCAAAAAAEGETEAAEAAEAGIAVIWAAAVADEAMAANDASNSFHEPATGSGVLAPAIGSTWLSVSSTEARTPRPVGGAGVGAESALAPAPVRAKSAIERRAVELASGTAASTCSISSSKWRVDDDEAAAEPRLVGLAIAHAVMQ